MPGIRPEARPLLLKDLSVSQGKAVEDISWSLLSALDDLERVKKERDARPAENRDRSQEIDRHRSSRIFFVSGEPGSGKSSVYLTLRDHLENPGKGETYEGFPKLEELRSKRQEIRWLEPLDLEPAADSTNFLAAILVRIEQAIEGSSQEAPGRTRRPGLLESNADPRQELQRLQNDIVLAWDGNVPQRAEHVEPDIYSVEVLRAEKARLSVNPRLHETLDRLTRQKEQDVLFVLPVDDFYLKPTSSLQLLRLLRMIYVPRLFILLLGDYDVIGELFYQDILGQLVRLAGERTLQTADQQSRALTARASALTSHALRKLLPLAQRSIVEVMDKLQALDFSPEKLGVTSREALSLAGMKSESKVKLRDLLEKSKLEFRLTTRRPAEGSELRPSDLYKFLVLRSEDDEKDDPYTYSGLEALDLTPREVVDLWSKLAKVVRESAKENDIIELVIEQSLEALSGQTYLSWDEQERCREAIQGAAYSERIFVTSALKVSPKCIPSGEYVALGRRLSVSSHQGWSIKPTGFKEKDEGAINYMPPRPRAWFTVLHDLMALSMKNRLSGPPLVPKPFELPWISISAEQAGEKPICWPTPAWPSFWHFDRLGFSWNKVVGSLSKKLAEETTDPEKLVDWLAYNWIRCITSILLLDGTDLKEEPPDVVDWEALVNKTADLLASDVGRNWLTDLRKSAIPDSVKGRFPEAAGPSQAPEPAS